MTARTLISTPQTLGNLNSLFSFLPPTHPPHLIYSLQFQFLLSEEEDDDEESSGEKSENLSDDNISDSDFIPDSDEEQNDQNQTIDLRSVFLP